MRAIDLAQNDLRLLLRDWKTALFLVILPIVFTLMFGVAFGGFGGSRDDRMPVGILDLDQSVLSRALADALAASDAVRPEPAKRSSAQQLEDKVVAGKLVAAVTVPAGYSDAYLSGSPLALDAVVAGGSAGLTAQNELRAAVWRLAGAAEAARIALQTYEDQARLSAGSVPALDEPGRRDLLAAAVTGALEGWKRPHLTLEATLGSGGDKGGAVTQSGFLHTSPSMMVQFAIAGLIGAGTILVMERKSGAMRRLLTTPISRMQIVAGHYLAIVALLLAQLLLLAVFGQLALRVPYFATPFATLLVIVCTALWTGALGLLIGTLAKTDDQVVLFSLVPMFVLSGMGGAWVPLEFTGKTFQAIGHLLPTAWAMDGFENLVLRGLGLGSVWLPAGVMLGYAAVLLALAAWRFRFE